MDHEYFQKRLFEANRSGSKIKTSIFTASCYQFRGLHTKIVACCLSSLIACAGSPPKKSVVPSIEPGRSYAQVADEMHTTRRLPAFEFVAGEHRMALFYVDANGALVDSIVSEHPTIMLFEDDSYLGALSADLALMFEVCLGQPTGRDLLAERLRMLADGKPDPYATAFDAGLDAEVPKDCPSGLRPPRQKPESSELAKGLTGAALYSAGLILAPLALVMAPPVLSVAYLQQRRALERQSGLQLGDNTSDITQSLGEPDDRFLMPSTGTEVFHYRPHLYLGLQDERLIWLRWSDSKWLAAIRTQFEQERKNGVGDPE